MPGIKEEIKKQALVSGYDKPVTTPSIKDDIKAEGLKKYSASESNDLTKDYFNRKQTAERTSILSEDQFKGLTKGVSFEDASDILERPFNPITEDIGYLAATEQSVGYQIGAFANQLQGAVIGQTIEGIGYLGDVAHWGDKLSGGEGDWGNWLSDIGTAYQDLTREGTPIYQTRPGEFNPSSSGWWFNNGVSIGSSLALLIPAMGVTSLLGKAARATKLFDAAVKLGAKVGLGAEQVGTIGTVLGRSLASRQMENMMEANGTFKEVEQKYLNLGYDEVKAKSLASEAASDVYKSNWPLIIQDVMQMALIAKGPIFTKAIDSAAVAKAAGKSVGAAVAKAGYTKGWDMLTEGMEEAYQFIVAEEAKYAIDASMGLKPKSTFGDRLEEYAQDGEMWTSAMFGALGAGVMHATAPLLNKLQGGKSEAQIRIDEIKSRATTFSAFSKLYKEAAQSGNEFGIEKAHMGLETDLAVRAYQTGNLDLILEDIEKYKSMSAEEKEANGFSPDTDFNKVKKGVEETVELIKTISKNYDSLVVPKAAYLSRLTTLLEANKTNTKSKESLLLSKFPGLDKLSSEGRTVFDTFVNFKALQYSLNLNKNTLASNLTEFSRGELEKKIAKDEIELSKLEKQVDEYLNSDNLNKDDINIINNSIDTPFGHNIMSNKASQLLLDHQIDSSIKELAHLSKKETVDKLKAEIAKNQKAAENKAKADEIAAKNKANEDALNDNKAKSSADQQQAATTAIPSDEEILATIANGDTINMTDAELEQLAEEQGVTLQDAKVWQKQAIKDFNKKKDSYVTAAGKATKTTSAEIITNTTNDDNIPTPANPEELEEDIEPKGAAKITTGLALAWKSAGNLSSDILDQVNNKELSDFLENPNIDLSKYDLEVSIDWDKIDRLEAYAGLREAIANGTADVGMIPVKAVITLNGEPVTSNGKPFTLYLHDTDYDFAEKHKADAIQEVLDLKNAVVANQNKKITAKIVDRSEGHLNSDIDSNGKFVQHSLLESISDKLENLKFTVGGNGGVYMSVGSNKDTHPDLESFTSAKPGAVYVIVKRADGLKVPLRTWVAGISEEDSNVVYSTYKAILNNPEIYQDKLSKEFKESVNLSNLPLDLSKVTYKQLLEFFVFEGSKTKGMGKQELFTSKEGVIIAGEFISIQDFNTAEGAYKFKQALVKNKNRQINRVYLSNEKYVKYLVNNNILTTNVIKRGENVFVQPTLTIGDLNIGGVVAAKKTTTTSTQTTQQTPTDAKADIERRRKESINGYIDEDGDFVGIKQFTKERKDRLDELGISTKQIVGEWEGFYLEPDISGKLGEESQNVIKYIEGKTEQEVKDKINAKYDAEYVDKVKKGEFTAQQAKEALKEINRLTPELSKQIDNAELADLKDKVVSSGVGGDVKLDPDLKNIDPTIIAARNGDKQAQKKLEEYGLDWEQTTTYRFVGQSEVDVLLSGNKVESKRFTDAGIDVTTSSKVTSAANNEYRVTFKESFDVNNGLGKVKLKSKEEGDHNLEKGRGYTLNDVAKIEKIDENGNVVETVYEQSAPEQVETSKANIESQKAEYKREDFPDSQANTRTPVTQKLLDYFAEVLGIPKFTEDLSKGTYISWLQKVNPLGYAIAEKLNAPKQAFDIIAEYDAELAALNKPNALSTEEVRSKLDELKLKLSRARKARSKEAIQKEIDELLEANPIVEETIDTQSNTAKQDEIIRVRNKAGFSGSVDGHNVSPIYDKKSGYRTDSYYSDDLRNNLGGGLVGGVKGAPLLSNIKGEISRFKIKGNVLYAAVRVYDVARGGWGSLQFMAVKENDILTDEEIYDILETNLKEVLKSKYIKEVDSQLHVTPGILHDATLVPFSSKINEAATKQQPETVDTDTKESSDLINNLYGNNTNASFTPIEEARLKEYWENNKQIISKHFGVKSFANLKNSVKFDKEKSDWILKNCK